MHFEVGVTAEQEVSDVVPMYLISERIMYTLPPLPLLLYLFPVKLDPSCIP